MGGGGSKDDDLGALPTQEVVSIHGASASLRATPVPRAAPAPHTGVQEVKVHAFWDKSSFRLERAGASKFLWNFLGDFVAEVPCELSVHFHCRERLDGGRLKHILVEEAEGCPQ